MMMAPAEEGRRLALACRLLLLLFLLATTGAAETGAQVTKTLSGIPFRTGSGGLVPSKVERIEYVSVTVDDLGLATRFYRDVLGATPVEFCNGIPPNPACTGAGEVRFSGDQYLYALFGTDMPGNPSKLTSAAPSIGTNGDHEVLSLFFVLGNSVIQLVKFASKTTGKAFNLTEPMTSPVWMAKAHIDFWVEDGVDANNFILDVETRSHAMGMPDVKFNRPVPQETRADRASVPVSKFANKVRGNSFDGLSWAYFKGPIGEQLEMYEIERTIKQGVGRAYCHRGAVSKAFTSAASNETAVRDLPLSQRLFGLFQWGFRTGNLNRAAAFYTEVLGGDLITYPTQGIEIMRDDSAHWMILANETIEAYEYAAQQNLSREVAMDHYAVPNISSTGYCRLDHRFILFDNFVVEPLKYTRGLSFQGDGYDPILNHSSSAAYIGTIVGAFGISPNESLSSYVENLFKPRLGRQGFRNVQPPVQIATFPETHPYGGLEVGYAKGTDGETFALVSVGNGSFARALKAAMVGAGAVSTLFEETNIYASGAMDDFCAYAQEVTNGQSVQVQTVGKCELVDDSAANNAGNNDDCKDEHKQLLVALVVIGSLSLFVLLVVVGCLLRGDLRRAATPASGQIYAELKNAQ
eukprot:CAMPEP_0114530770 /NCGR_PEP_ID=MMETSP0109-20121206/25648_1 /TAXON_ID=29199 /ORGANISM="Chlorarachnion reptans, Strain CCCM449" /LENGTH=635 /DNA_ID=CAMNT_0001713467 /DNA_START=39 /DNA_END=1947 /DNA_ORIENTATION=-